MKVEKVMGDLVPSQSLPVHQCVLVTSNIGSYNKDYSYIAHLGIITEVLKSSGGVKQTMCWQGNKC